MYHSDETFAQQIGVLCALFQSYCGASCLFYLGKDTLVGIRPPVGLRIEAGQIGKQFVDNLNFGHDPEGLLFYNSVDDFNASEAVTYKVYKNTESSPTIRVDFFASEGRRTFCFCSFITRDTNGISELILSQFINEGRGTWRDNKVASSYSTLFKVTKSPTVTLYVAPIGKKIVWKIDDSHHALDFAGMFSFDALSELDDGTTATVNYDADRIVFFRETDRKVLGVFFPSVSIPLDNNATGNWPIATIDDWPADAPNKPTEPVEPTKAIEPTEPTKPVNSNVPAAPEPSAAHTVTK